MFHLIWALFIIKFEIVKRF